MIAQPKTKANDRKLTAFQVSSASLELLLFWKVVS